MSLVSDLNAQLTPLERQNLSVQNPGMIELESDAGTISIALVDVHGLACAVAELRLQSAAMSSCDTQSLKVLSDALAGRLQYLLEPVSPIEIDEDSVTIQMRSNPPSHDEENGRSYYELVAKQSGLSVIRFFKRVGSPRERVSMTFTREVLGRLIKDMVTTVSEST